VGRDNEGMASFQRKTKPFEVILLIIGMALIVFGYLAIQRMISIDKGFSWELLQTTFLWLLMIFFVVLAAVNENMKEELKVVITNQWEELRLLRQELRMFRRP
jgi:hypothetical protein